MAFLDESRTVSQPPATPAPGIPLWMLLPVAAAALMTGGVLARLAAPKPRAFPPRGPVRVVSLLNVVVDQTAPAGRRRRASSRRVAR